MPFDDLFAHPATRLTLEIFRLNGALIALGDALASPYGLTSARWQVLGAIAQANGSLPVAGIARTMGLVRQSVQRIADDLAALDLVAFAPNPHHRRAKLVQLTARGESVFETVTRRWNTLADTLIETCEHDATEADVAHLQRFRQRVETLLAQLQDTLPPSDETDEPPLHPQTRARGNSQR